MRKHNCFLRIVYLSVLCLVLFAFKDHLRSETDTSAVPLESNPRGIAISPVTDIAVIANEKSNSVSIIDLKTQTVLSSITVGKAPRSVAIDKGLNVAVVGNSHNNNISIIDLNTYRLISTIPVGKEPEGIAVDYSIHRAYVTNHKDDTISVVDLMNFSVIRTVPVGKNPEDVVIDPELNLGLVVKEKGNKHEKGNKEKNKKKEEKEKECEDHYAVSVIDLNTYLEARTIPVGRKPWAIDINPETHIAAVVDEKGGSITIIDLQGQQTNTIETGKHPVDIAINSLDNRALVICDKDRSLIIIDLDTNTIVREYSLNKLSRGVAVNNFTNVAAIVDDKTDSLTLIQLPSPIPEITSITPDNAPRGSGEIKIDIEGSRFITSSIAYLDNQPLSTTFTDNHHIHETITGEMLSMAGTFSVTISNPSPDGGTSNSSNFTVNNPPPTITAFDPAEAGAGTSGLTVLINGTGFFEDTEVFFGGTKKPTTFRSGTTLHMWLSSEDLKTPGQYEVMANNSPPGGGSSNKVIFAATGFLMDLYKI